MSTNAERPPRCTWQVIPGDPGPSLLWEHECNFPDLEGSTYHRVRLPINDARGWRIEQVEPLTVSPSILCGSCGTHGFWRAGKWVPA